MAEQIQKDADKLSELQMVVAQLGEEEYGIPILQIQEIALMTNITKISGMPSFVKGVINLRGKIVPVIDLRERFGFEKKEYTDKTRIVIVQIEKQSVGLIVDSVSEVIRIKLSDIDSVPSTISQIGEEYINGVAKVGNNKLIILLNIEKLLGELDKVSVKKISESRKE